MKDKTAEFILSQSVLYSEVPLYTAFAISVVESAWAGTGWDSLGLGIGT